MDARDDDPRPEAEPVRAPRRAAWAMALLSCAALAYEVTLTRVFSFVTWYHFVYLVIGIALLGYGAAGSMLTFFRRAGDGLLAGAAAGFGALGLVSVWLLGRIPFDPASLYVEPGRQLLGLSLLVLALFPPFLSVGAAIGGLLSRWRADAGRIYFYDLAGAGVGCAATPTLLAWLGAPALAGWLSLAAAAGGALLARTPRQRSLPALAAAAAALWLAVLALRGEPELAVPPAKPLHHLRAAGIGIEHRRWSALPRIDVTEERTWPLWGFGGDLAERFHGVQWPMRGVLQDGTAQTAMLRLSGPEEIARMDFLGGYVQGAAFRLRPGGSALVIGVGGGIDVLIALHTGLRRVVGVEVNPHIAELLTGRYHGFTGRVFSDPRVELVVAEGRHFLSTTSERFDAIQLSGVDTFAALSSGAYALAEAYLYTVEAVGDFLDHLAPGGLLSYSRYEFEPPRETIRNVSNMIEALRRRGVPDPAGRLMVVAGKEWANCMVKPDGFTAEEKEAVRRSTAALGFRVSYDPDRPGHDAYDRLVRAGPEERAAFLRDYAYDVSPVLDDRPFFFQYFKPRTLLRPPPGVDLRRDWPVVVPTGLLTLAVTLVLLTLLSALLILAPLRGRVGAGAGARRGAVFGYFAALGLGFLFVEITLMQAFTVFLGNPTYALSVVLFTLLSSSAVGSALTQGRDARLTLLALPPVLVAAAFGLRAALPALLGLPLAGRIACTMALLAPLGLLLGTAFPQGIRRLAGAAPALVPWAFAVNACFTVLGSASAVLLALLAGFRVPMIAAALLYALAAALLPRLATGRPID